MQHHLNGTYTRVHHEKRLCHVPWLVRCVPYRMEYLSLSRAVIQCNRESGYKMRQINKQHVIDVLSPARACLCLRVLGGLIAAWHAARRGRRHEDKRMSRAQNTYIHLFTYVVCTTQLKGRRRHQTYTAGMAKAKRTGDNTHTRTRERQRRTRTGTYGA